MEAGRADSITRDKLRVLKEFGVTRISVNPQTMNQETLNIIGRRHTVQQVEEALPAGQGRRLYQHQHGFSSWGFPEKQRSMWSGPWRR